jgi:hypothetical protein
MPLERLLRIYFTQQWFNLPDPQVEWAPYDSSLRKFKPRQRRYLSGMRISCSVVSTTNMASSRAGFVELALALTLWWSPGISVQLSPAV